MLATIEVHVYVAEFHMYDIHVALNQYWLIWPMTAPTDLQLQPLGTLHTAVLAAIQEYLLQYRYLW